MVGLFAHFDIFLIKLKMVFACFNSDARLITRVKAFNKNKGKINFSSSAIMKKNIRVY